MTRCALAAITAGLLATGCASIPDSGSVEAGDRIRQEAPGALSVIPPGPQPDAEPTQIVRGFIEAAAIQVEAARDFLTADAQQQWPPSERIVYAGLLGEPVEYDEGRRATVMVNAVATIDDGGRYEPVVATGEAMPPQSYELSRVGGQWRLSDVPETILVAEDDLGRLIRPYRVYFGDRSRSDERPLGRYLVPDVRWFPAPESATAVARAVLDGPSEPLAGSVETVDIPGLALSDLGVDVSDGIATVDLNEAFRAAGDREDALLRLQLSETLTALPRVSDVRITVQGNLVGARPVSGASPSSEPEVALTNPYVLRRAAVAEPDAPDPAAGDAPTEPVSPATEAAQVAPARIEQISESGDPTELPRLRRLADRIDDGLAVSPGDPGVVAGRGPGGTIIWSNTPSGGTHEVVSDGVDLTAPSFDPDGWLWTVSQGPGPAPVGAADPSAAPSWPGPTFVAAKDGDVVTQPLSRLVQASDRVTTFRVSRDGTRVLLIVQAVDRSVRVQVAGVVRDAGGRPRSLSVSSFRLLPDLVEAVDATWVQSDTVAVLGSINPGEVRPFVVQVGGVAKELPPLAGARSITAGRGDRTIVIGTDDGTVVRREGGSWSREGQPGWSPAY